MLTTTGLIICKNIGNNLSSYVITCYRYFSYVSITYAMSSCSPKFLRKFQAVLARQRKFALRGQRNLPPSYQVFYCFCRQVVLSSMILDLVEAIQEALAATVL